MNKKQLLLISLIQIMVLGSLYLFFTVPFGETEAKIEENSSGTSSLESSNGMIPFDYYQKIKIGENYIYNVSGFGSAAQWLNFTGGSVDWNTDSGEQIFINFTGFYNRDPNDPGDTFPGTDMPWMNISIFESGEKLNYTYANVSNSEVSRNLKLGFADFQPGFLITVNHTDLIKANATLEANGASGSTADLTIEETYNFLYFRFQNITDQCHKVGLIYDRFSGLLIRANTTVGTYHLEINLLNYSLSFEQEYVYEILEFGPPGFSLYYDLWFTYIDTYALRTGSWIKINFTGYYNRDPKGEPWPGFQPYDEFYYSTPKRAWLDIKTVYNGDVYDVITMFLENRSNQEASVAFLLGIGPFVSGFLLPEVNNKSYDMQAHAQNGATSIFNTLTYTETDLTIKIDSKHTVMSGFPQDTCLIYEKYTGLLLWADTYGQNYHLKMKIENYTPLQEAGPAIDTENGDEDKDDKNRQQAIPSFPLFIFFSVIISTSLILTFKIVNKKKRVKIL